MFSLTRYTTPCPEPVNSQILQMVVDNLTDISSVALAPSNLLYNIYQYAIGFEVHLYLEALNGERASPSSWSWRWKTRRWWVFACICR